ncbi:unnamed protein product [Heligmosomoides polygyrus]|uniref:Copine domain-containing protein n=1 Tax=Heligmosomoides polygyrus TaxID=6339 RepID=A0A183F5V5_HELPZ|nr:unnamed protein product [Heligmosomoides polygyrus]
MKCCCSTSSAVRSRQPPPQDVILFVVGGGNYVEYQNLVDYGRSKGLHRVTYGCTELVNPKQFTDQVSVGQYSGARGEEEMASS